MWMAERRHEGQTPGSHRVARPVSEGLGQDLFGGGSGMRRQLISPGELLGVGAGLVGGELGAAEEVAGAAPADDHDAGAAGLADGRTGVARGVGAAGRAAGDSHEAAPAGLAAGGAVAAEGSVEAGHALARTGHVEPPGAAAGAGGRVGMPAVRGIGGVVRLLKAAMGSGWSGPVARKTGGSETPPLRSGRGVRRRWAPGWWELGRTTTGRRAGQRHRPYARTGTHLDW